MWVNSPAARQLLLNLLCLLAMLMLCQLVTHIAALH
jgi:hypothetical protein